MKWAGSTLILNHVHMHDDAVHSYLIVHVQKDNKTVTIYRMCFLYKRLQANPNYISTCSLKKMTCYKPVLLLSLSLLSAAMVGAKVFSCLYDYCVCVASG